MGNAVMGALGAEIMVLRFDRAVGVRNPKSQSRTFGPTIQYPFHIHHTLGCFSFLSRRILRGHSCKWVVRLPGTIDP